MCKISVAITSEWNIAEAVREARRVASAMGFPSVKVSYIATATSELATNLFIHAGGGFIEISRLTERTGLEVAALDHGPGIADIAKALQDGYSTVGGLGCGLPGARRLTDEFEIRSQIGQGTVVRARTWL